MSEYIVGIAIFALVLSPLFIPIVVTVIHGVGSWRRYFSANPAEPTRADVPLRRTTAG
jgi:hypothetical protein